MVRHEVQKRNFSNCEVRRHKNVMQNIPCHQEYSSLVILELSMASLLIPNVDAVLSLTGTTKKKFVFSSL